MKQADPREAIDAFRDLASLVGSLRIAGTMTEGLARAIDADLHQVAQEIYRWENKTLFSKVRHRWFPPPPDLEAHYKAATEAFGALSGILRTDENLRDLSRDLYPEIDLSLPPSADPHSPPNGDQSSRQIAEIHAVNQLLQAVEHAWLGVKLEGYPEHPMNRGWMSTFRRLANSDTIQKTWPIVRGKFSQEFVRFCERELKLPDGAPEAIPLNSGLVREDLVDRSLADLDHEFAMEWRTEPGLDELRERARRLETEHQVAPTSWIVWSNPPEQCGGGGPFACGIMLVMRAEPEGEDDSSGTFEFFAWIRGAYRNQGIGRRCIQGPLFQETLKGILKLRPDGRFKVQVRYPTGGRGPGGDKMQRKIWKSFFHHYDFRGAQVPREPESRVILERRWGGDSPPDRGAATQDGLAAMV